MISLGAEMLQYHVFEVISPSIGCRIYKCNVFAWHESTYGTNWVINILWLVGRDAWSRWTIALGPHEHMVHAKFCMCVYSCEWLCIDGGQHIRPLILFASSYIRGRNIATNTIEVDDLFKFLNISISVKSGWEWGRRVRPPVCASAI